MPQSCSYLSGAGTSVKARRGRILLQHNFSCHVQQTTDVNDQTICTADEQHKALSGTGDINLAFTVKMVKITFCHFLVLLETEAGAVYMYLIKKKIMKNNPLGIYFYIYIIIWIIYSITG